MENMHTDIRGIRSKYVIFQQRKKIADLLK